MRLIDADALAEEIEKNMENGFPANEYLSLYAISCIAHAPTVDVLDKIRAEIIKQFEGCYLEEDMTDERKAEHKAYKNVLKIIDKYRKSEE